jgi:hypothetical protein
MRTRNALEHLAVAGQPLVAAADALVDAGEQEEILGRIVASERSRIRRRRPIALALVAAVAVVGAIAAVATHGNAAHPVRIGGGHHRVALTGVTIETAGYRFKTPAGFTASQGSCTTTQSLRAMYPRRVTGTNGFTAAASAEGGCIDAFFVLSPKGTPGGADATPIDVGSYQGYYLSADGYPGESALYVELPKADPSAASPVYLALFSQGLSEDQLIAIAESGLPGRS